MTSHEPRDAARVRDPRYDATYAGRRYGEECDAPPPAEGAVPFQREIAQLLPKAAQTEHPATLIPEGAQ